MLHDYRDRNKLCNNLNIFFKLLTNILEKIVI
jgi:hypothetical protein